MKLWYVLVPILVLSTGCSSTLIVKSDPIDAEVFYENPQTNEKKALGRTPLDMKYSAFKEIVGNTVESGEYYTLTVEKKDFQPGSFIVPASRFGTLVTNLDVKLKPGTAPKESRTARDILNQIFLAQKMAKAKEYERAQTEIDKILTNFPDFPRALSMRGSIYFMQKNYTESLKWYEKALQADPQMEEALTMSAKVRALLGGKPITEVNTGKK